MSSVEYGEIIQHVGDLQVVRPHRLPRDGQRLIERRLGFRVLSLGLVDYGQLVHDLCDLHVFRPERLLLDRQRPLQKRLRLCVLPLPVEGRPQIEK